MIDNMCLYDYYLVVVGVNPNEISSIINSTTLKLRNITG